MTNSTVNSLDIRKQWKAVIRLITYRMVFHSEGAADVPNAVRGITSDPEFQTSIADVLACAAVALSMNEDLGKSVHDVESRDLTVRTFLSELITALSTASHR